MKKRMSKRMMAFFSDVSVDFWTDSPRVREILCLDLKQQKRQNRICRKQIFLQRQKQRKTLEV